MAWHAPCIYQIPKGKRPSELDVIMVVGDDVQSQAREARQTAPETTSSAPVQVGRGPGVALRRGQWRRFLGVVARQEWTAPLAWMLLDVSSWVTLYGTISYVRVDDAYYTAPLQFLVVGLIQIVVIIQALFIIGGYNRRTEMQTLAYATEHILVIVAAAAISSLLIYSAATYDDTMKPSRGVLLLSFLAFTPVSLAYRRMVGRYVSASTAHRAYLVLGTGDLAAEFYREYKKSPTRQRLEFVDITGKKVGQHIAGPGTPVIEGDIETKLERLGDRYSGVVLAERVDRLQPALLDRLVRTQFHDTRVYTMESFYEAHWRHVPVQSLDPFWPLQMGFQLAQISPYHYLKRLFDLLFAGLLLVLCAPLVAFIAVLIRLADGAPAFFRQTRLGREGDPFTLYKFRTMVAASASEQDDIYTRQGDPRVTRLGRWLRKLRLDELPQLWNVFRGEMSLIGPRAEWDKCAERYEKTIPFYHFRHLVKPGITGWAQVNYPYGESDEDTLEKLKYDLYYIRRYSPKLDLMIVLKTVHTMLFGQGR